MTKEIDNETFPHLIRTEFFPVRENLIYVSAANVCPTFAKSTESIIKWQKDLMLYGANKFNDKEEKNAYLDLREVAGKLLGTDSKDIACGSSATVLLSSFAWSYLPDKNSNIVSTAAAFPSTVYPWHRVAEHTGAQIRLAQYDKNYYTKTEDIINLIDHNTHVVCLSHVEYTNGQVYDLKHIANIAHKNNALLVIDATQSAGVLPINVNELGIDVLVSAAYKWLCGSFGSAIMYIKPEIYKNLNPGLLGFRSHKDIWDCDASRIKLSDEADKYEFATTHFGSAKGLSLSIDLLLSLGISNIHRYDIFLADKLIEGLNNIPYIDIITPYKERIRSPIVTFRSNTLDTQLIINQLKQEKIIVSNRSGMVRLSPHLYNTKEEMEIVINTIKDIFKNNPHPSHL